MLDTVKQLTEEKKYELINYIDFDKDDSKIHHDYYYEESKAENRNPHKYIATVLEAMIGAIYKETNEL